MCAVRAEAEQGSAAGLEEGVMKALGTGGGGACDSSDGGDREGAACLSAFG